MKYSLLLALLVTACGDTGCRIEETTTRVSKGSETFLERCWREVCPGVSTQILRCSKI